MHRQYKKFYLFYKAPGESVAEEVPANSQAVGKLFPVRFQRGENGGHTRTRARQMHLLRRIDSRRVRRHHKISGYSSFKLFTNFTS